MKWFRFYHEVIDDPKVELLPAEVKWGWVQILCLANQGEPRGSLPSVEIIAFRLRTTAAAAADLLDRLKAAGLIDQTRNGLVPHNWDARQHTSDDAAARKSEYRRKSKPDKPIEPKEGIKSGHVTVPVLQHVTGHVPTNVPRHVTGHVPDDDRTSDGTCDGTLTRSRAEFQSSDSEEDGGGVAGARTHDSDSRAETPTIETTPRGFPIRSDGHREAVGKARELFGDDLAEAVADQGQAIEYAIWQGEGPRWDCYVAAIEAAKRSTKPIGNVLTYALSAAKRFCVHGIPPPPVAYSGGPLPDAPAAPGRRRAAAPEMTPDQFKAALPDY